MGLAQISLTTLDVTAAYKISLFPSHYTKLFTLHVGKKAYMRIMPASIRIEKAFPLTLNTEIKLLCTVSVKGLMTFIIFVQVVTETAPETIPGLF